MYCPRCSQQQSSDTVRFCSRCGLPLIVVKELLDNDGVLPASGTPARGRNLSPREKGTRLGAKIMFFSAALLIPFFGLSIAAEEPAPLIVPFTLFFIGLLRLLYARMFDEYVPPKYQAQPYLIEPPPKVAALPAEQDVIFKSPLSRGADTGDIVEPGRSSPPSVTEHTTKLFEDQKQG
ncbi:MAG: hypothetical protein L0229_09920 [Blastocatellia bacterium]|nr:hypothetical protein [Blastocatellia bacterium]